MTQAFQKLKMLALRLTGVLVIYSLIRIIFILIYYGNLKATPLADILLLMLYGLRYDVSAILITNSLFILFSLLPLDAVEHLWYRRSLRVLFMITNGLAIATAVTDLVYFRYSNRRMTGAFFHFLSRKEDSWNLMHVFLKDFWYMFLFFILLVFCLSWILKYTHSRKAYIPLNGKARFAGTAVMLITVGLTIIGIRGGLQIRPLKVIVAGNYCKASDIPFVLNTPYTVMETIAQPALQQLTYLPPASAALYYNPLKNGSSPEAPVGYAKRNIVIIILESFSKEYTGLAGSNTSSTPFLDSLMQHSLVMTNGYANGKQSVEGIPSILASLPSWFNKDYISSSYGTNKINCLGSILAHQGYQCSFYHGGKNGTMNFNNFIRLAGGGSYYGLNEYPDKADFDGNWGIWDEPYLQYFAKELNRMHEPFLSSVFTLSSHNPFDIPEKYKAVFPDTGVPVLRAVRYTDHALKLFFDSIKAQPWFKNTLFVFTADHTGIPLSHFNELPVGNYQVPILFYSPDNTLQKKDSTLFEQVDIMPTLLDLVQNRDPYFSFGTSLYDTSVKKFVLYNIETTFHFISRDTLIQFNGNKVTGVYSVRNDSLLKKNLLPYIPTDAIIQLKSVLQTYNKAIIDNKTTFPTGMGQVNSQPRPSATLQ